MSRGQVLNYFFGQNGKTEIAAVKILTEDIFTVHSTYTTNRSDLEIPFPKLAWDFFLCQAGKEVIIPVLVPLKEEFSLGLITS